jgi:hypothetical protein
MRPSLLDPREHWQPSKRHDVDDGLRIGQDVQIVASPEALFRLVADLPRYAEFEPRLVTARWTGPDLDRLRVGSTAEIVTDIPFTHRRVLDLLGSPNGIVTVTCWDPPKNIGAVFEGRTVVVRVGISLNNQGNVSIATIRGHIVPRSWWARIALRPFRSPLETLIARSVRRGARRLEHGLECGSPTSPADPLA